LLQKSIEIDRFYKSPIVSTLERCYAHGWPCSSSNGRCTHGRLSGDDYEAPWPMMIVQSH